jgi:hypothetical protein
MRYFANPSTQKVNEAMTAGLLDCITTPMQGNKIPDGAWICADNGCYGKGYPGDDKWFTWLQTLPAERCRFATAPDVVGDAAATLVRSLPWLAKIRSIGMPAAYVAQNGSDLTPPPWGSFDVLFLGGSPECLRCGYIHPIDAPKLPRGHKVKCPFCHRPATEWKKGAIARGLVGEAKALGLQVHMGRVNSGVRTQYAEAIGCDSVDGTYLTFAPDTNFPKILGWLHDVNSQHAFFGGSS